AALIFFFFQAEDGIRDLTVTGVQTCALPISLPAASPLKPPAIRPARAPRTKDRRPNSVLKTALSRIIHLDILLLCLTKTIFSRRSEERRVGKECRSRVWRNN